MNKYNYVLIILGCSCVNEQPPVDDLLHRKGKCFRSVKQNGNYNSAAVLCADAGMSLATGDTADHLDTLDLLISGSKTNSTSGMRVKCKI